MLLGSETVTLTEVVQSFLSFIPTVYVPTDKLLNTLEEAYDPPLILYVYGNVPPEPVIVILPVELPLQSTSTTLFELILKTALGSVIVTFTVFVQPLLSLMPKV